MVYFCIYYTSYIRIYAIGNLIILRENETITGLWGFGVSNSREAGNGRYDICVYNRVDETKPAAVIELKTAKKRKEMESAADEALAQIAEKKYDEFLAEFDYEECWNVGIGFCRKKCFVKIEKAEIEQEL
jgi:hypothetical protein